MEWLVSIGLRPELLSLDVHAKDKLAHYAQACTDIEFQFPFGKQELQGVAARGNYDLTQHAAASGKSMEYFDDALKEKYVPHVIEPSIGVDRLMLAVLTSAYCTDEVGGEKRTVLKFHPRLAPIKVAALPAAREHCTHYLPLTAHYSLRTTHYTYYSLLPTQVAVFPLLKNKPELVAKATELHAKLQRRYHVAYDATGAIGRRYRRMDEAGTPFCVTIDFDTLEGDGTVTLRERDSTEQRRIAIPELLEYLEEQIEG